MKKDFNTSDTNYLTELWLSRQRKSPKEQEQNNEYFDVFTSYDKAPQKVLEFILNTIERDLSDGEISILAAGELEDIISIQDEAIIKQIEEHARKLPKFRDLLGGVWITNLNPEFQHRIEKARNYKSW